MTDDSATTTDEHLPAPPVERALVAVVAVAVAAGTVLRFLPRSDLWLDEALTVNISTLPIGEIGEALRRDGHPPLFYWLLNGWTSLGGTSDWWVRALPGVISLAALPLAYLAGRRLATRTGAGPLGGHRTGLVALALMAILPYGIRYGSETRMYSLATTLALAGYLLVDDLLVRRPVGARRWWAAAGVVVVTAALLWTHYWSMWLLAVAGSAVLVLAWRTSDRAVRSGCWTVAAAMVVGGLLYLPWLPSLLYQSSRTGTPWGEQFGIVRVITTTVADFSGDTLTSYVTVLLAVLAVAGTVVLIRSRQHVVVDGAPSRRVAVEVGVLVLTLGLGWAMSTVTSTTYSARYAAVVYPMFVLVVAAGVALLRRTGGTVAVLAVVAVLSGYVATSSAMEDRTQAGQVAERIAADLSDRPDGSGTPVVVTCPDQIGVAVERSLRNRDVAARVVPFPERGDPRFIDWVDYAERNEAADPVAFWDELREEVDPTDGLYAVVMPGYQTFDGKCEQLLAVITAERPTLDTVEAADDGETMGLWILGPAA